ncbi:glycoside hydrolase family 2 TIM barrel-domain containing protein [Opitutus sp. ER46]|uniref:glycoside hydrolase family 2 TIM barrel-domain containing protein n=1 Tax=Opitutus sp. ER46 TaxID=2161864 RepID=UPI000D31BC82|nr:glycoside hydrolase family 2 TIM barrel-domain containing protein [Opitutus sp. ER46]PTX94383.1 glycoside hydrolase family 2 [Opitutus sp. ER46]
MSRRPALLPATFVATALILGVTGRLSAAAAPAVAAPQTEVKYLSGTGSADAVNWEFFCSEGRRSGTWTTIKVPSCWEQEGFGTYQFGMPFYGKPNPPGLAREQGKYRHSFDVPAEWNGRRVRLVFEGVMTDTQVRVNGISTGPAHQGGFYRFKQDITGLLKFGASNQLEVTVDKESANESVNLAERRADYWNFGGIFRPVYLEVLPAQYIDRAAIDARADGAFEAHVFLGNAAPEGVSVAAQILDPAGNPVGSVIETAPAPGSDRAVVRTTVPAPKLWSAETPHLYRVQLTLKQGGAPVHATTARFGFRTFEIRAGQGLFLNGQRILIKGVNRHAFWPETGRTLTRERDYADVRLIKSMNMNAVRTAHYPPDETFLEACDELGLYVMDELGGWHGKYDEPTGRRLIGEMVTRDVNHPSIVIWSNGNEGGWNPAVDGEFAVWDPQRRPVLHPQGKFGGVDTMHYRSYGETQEYLRAPELFLPTEFLHALYDGGGAAGLADYWEMMRRHPRSGGGYLWALADEGVARSDQGGRIDNVGAYAPDGIVGPHHEPEGSVPAIREIWSPVQLSAAVDAPDFRGVLRVENRYDFTPLNACTFAWKLVRFPASHARDVGHVVVTGGELAGPVVAPHGAGDLTLPLPGNWREADALHVTVKDPSGAELWTWSWSWKPAEAFASSAKPTAGAKAEYRHDYAEIVVFAGALELRFNKGTGELAAVRVAGKPVSLGGGPRFVAARRGDRTLDGSVTREGQPPADRVYKAVPTVSTLTGIEVKSDGADVVVAARYFGALQETRWRITPAGDVTLDYTYAYDGVVELMGVTFEYPEGNVQALRWLGRGPYRAWQNRTQGGILDVWSKRYNDPIPGESFVYPEFKGYHADWRWADFTTSEGRILVQNGTPGCYLGVFTPRDGRDALLYTLPATGIAVLDVIPAVRNKVNATDLVGPSSQAQRVEGERHGRVTFRFEP